MRKKSETLTQRLRRERDTALLNCEQLRREMSREQQRLTTLLREKDATIRHHEDVGESRKELELQGWVRYLRQGKIAVKGERDAARAKLEELRRACWGLMVELIAELDAPLWRRLWWLVDRKRTTRLREVLDRAGAHAFREP